MTRATATWTNTVVEDFQAGNFLRATKLLQQMLQNLEHLAQVHNHDGGTADGGVLVLADPLGLMFYGAAAAG